MLSLVLDRVYLLRDFSRSSLSCHCLVYVMFVSRSVVGQGDIIEFELLGLYEFGWFVEFDVG